MLAVLTTVPVRTGAGGCIQASNARGAAAMVGTAAVGASVRQAAVVVLLVLLLLFLLLMAILQRICADCTGNHAANSPQRSHARLMTKEPTPGRPNERGAQAFLALLRSSRCSSRRTIILRFPIGSRYRLLSIARVCVIPLAWRIALRRRMLGMGRAGARLFPIRRQRSRILRLLLVAIGRLVGALLLVRTPAIWRLLVLWRRGAVALLPAAVVLVWRLLLVRLRRILIVAVTLLGRGRVTSSAAAIVAVCHV